MGDVQVRVTINSTPRAYAQMWTGFRTWIRFRSARPVAPMPARCHDPCVRFHSVTARTLRLVMWAGLLALEVAVVVRYFAIPQFQSRQYAPPTLGHWEAETPFHNSPVLGVAAIVLLVIFVSANAALIVVVWRAFKDLVSGSPR